MATARKVTERIGYYSIVLVTDHSEGWALWTVEDIAEVIDQFNTEAEAREFALSLTAKANEAMIDEVTDNAGGLLDWLTDPTNPDSSLLDWLLIVSIIALAVLI